MPRTGATRFEDAVFGPREVQNAEIEDFVLLRSNGLPTYQLSVVVDDIDMRITHIIRGADHLSNTPKQALIYRALGATPPMFAHVPLILGPDRTRLSKRHGATSVGSYADEGFLPEAFRNFLALLGWSPGDDSEYLRTTELIERFALSGVSRTNAIFDRDKLEWFNTQYLQKPPVEELLPYVEAELKRAGLWQEAWAGTERAWFAQAVELIRSRTRLLRDFTTWARAFFTDDFDYDAAAREKFWNDERLPTMLRRLADALALLTEWNHDACDAALRGLASAEGVKAGLLINATRVAIVGRAVAPPLFETMVVLGKDRVVARLRRALPFVRPTLASLGSLLVAIGFDPSAAPCGSTVTRAGWTADEHCGEPSRLLLPEPCRSTGRLRAPGLRSEHGPPAIEPSVSRLGGGSLRSQPLIGLLRRGRAENFRIHKAWFCTRRGHFDGSGHRNLHRRQAGRIVASLIAQGQR